MPVRKGNRFAPLMVPKPEVKEEEDEEEAV
jgi:hypothetical protein